MSSEFGFIKHHKSEGRVRRTFCFGDMIESNVILFSKKFLCIGKSAIRSYVGLLSIISIKACLVITVITEPPFC